MHKPHKIYVNGKPYFRAGSMTYDDVMELAFPDVPKHLKHEATMTYYTLGGVCYEGIMDPNSKVKLREGVVFNAAFTNDA